MPATRTARVLDLTNALLSSTGGNLRASWITGKVRGRSSRIFPLAMLVKAHQARRLDYRITFKVGRNKPY